jgi:hypothetical protein
MLLRGAEGNELGIALADYEFPESLGDARAANWLAVVLYVQSEQGIGWCQTPALLTWEVVRLAMWLDDRACGQPIASHLDEFMLFAEPNLQIHFEGADERAVALGIIFNMERPGEWMVEGRTSDERAWTGKMRLTASLDQLRVAAEDLRGQAHDFPVRQASTRTE